MKVQIYSPTRTAMQSGVAKTGDWVVEFPAGIAPTIDPLMGWIGMPDTTQQLRLFFATEAEAIDYAKRNNLRFELAEPKKRVIKPKSYAKNFEFKPSAQG